MENPEINLITFLREWSRNTAAHFGQRLLIAAAVLFATVSELGDSSVNLAAQPFLLRSAMNRLRYDSTEQVQLHFEEEGISIPYPQLHVQFYPATPLSGSER